MLWDQFSIAWPNIWRSQWGKVGGPGFDSWRRSLADLTADQIARGVERVLLDGHEYPPKPGQFRRRCIRTATELGLPGTRRAYILATQRRWEHPIIWKAVQRCADEGLDSRSLRGSQERDVWPIWERVYEAMLREADQGAEFTMPEARPAISHDPVPQAVDMSPEEARNEMRRRFGKRGRQAVSSDSRE